MKIPNATKGSFGIPKDIQEMAEKAKARKEFIENQTVEEQTEEGTQEWPMKEEPESNPEEVKDKEREQSDAYTVNPIDVLKKIGVTPTEEDFHSLIFRGFVEKIVPIAKNPINGQTLTAKLKTLTAEEVDLADELVAESLEITKMTNSGLDIRRSVWILAFAVSELNGRPLVKPVMSSDKTLDHKETAKAKKAVIGKLSPYIIDKLIRVHAQISSCYNMIATDPESAQIKK